MSTHVRSSIFGIKKVAIIFKFKPFSAIHEHYLLSHLLMVASDIANDMNPDQTAPLGQSAKICLRLLVGKVASNEHSRASSFNPLPHRDAF